MFVGIGRLSQSLQWYWYLITLLFESCRQTRFASKSPIRYPIWSNCSNQQINQFYSRFLSEGPANYFWKHDLNKVSVNNIRMVVRSCCSEELVFAVSSTVDKKQSILAWVFSPSVNITETDVKLWSRPQR